MLQIQFLDDNVVDALVPAFSLEPKHIIFIYDRRDISEKRVKNVIKAVNGRIPNTIVDAVHTYMYVISEIKNTILSCIHDFMLDNICIDITGETELMTASGLLMHEDLGIQVTYTNLQKGYMYDVVTGEKIVDIKHVTADDYLLAIGAKHFMWSHSLPKGKEYDAICLVAEYLFENLGEWHALHKYLSEYCSNSNDMFFSIDKDIEYLGHTYNSEKALAIFSVNGFIEKIAQYQYRFKNNKAKEYMINFSVWLEMYIH